MTEELSRKNEAEPLLAAWIKWTMDFWESTAQMGPGLAGLSGLEGGRRETAQPPESWLSSLKLWQAFFSLLTEPGTVAAMFQGIRAPSEIIVKMAQAGLGAYLQLHRQWLAAWQGEAVPSGAGELESLDQDIFKICSEIFEGDFRQLLSLPHLRLTCLSPQCLNRATDKFSQFHAAMAEFIYLLFLPVKKSLRAMVSDQGAGAAGPPEDFKEYYLGWLKILEGHYMTLLQSGEYIRSMNHALNALEDFTVAKQELLTEAIEALALPTRRDLDALYREIYLLRKSTKLLARQLDQPAAGREGD